MINTIVVEDEPLVSRGFVSLLKQVDEDINVVKILNSVKNSINYFKQTASPDLVFMDIQLSDGVSFDIFNDVDISCPIIFTTAYDEYAIRAFQINSIGYLLKPVDPLELKHSIEKFKKLQSKPFNYPDQVTELLKYFKLPQDIPKFKERFQVHSGKSNLIIDQKNIAYFEKDVLIYLITKDQQKYITSFQTIDEIEELLNPEYFFRANRQIILRLDSIESYKADLTGKLIIKLKNFRFLEIDISREKSKAFKDWIN